MSKETIEWLNNNTMIGNIEKREAYANSGWVMFNESTGQNQAWWHRDDYEHGYVGPIPAEEIERVLFHWTPVETEIMHKRRDGVTPETADAIDGAGPYLWVPDMDRKGIMHPDTEHVFGIFGMDSYQVHNYRDALLNQVAAIVDDENLGFGTAGLLRNGGVAYVTAELPDNVTVAGMDIRPQILACTSVDGTKATTYKLTTNVVVCDNSLDIALRGSDSTFKVKHSSRSLGRLTDAQEALGVLFSYTEEMEKLLAGMADTPINDKQFRLMAATFKPVPTPEHATNKKGNQVVKNQRAITVAENVNNDLFNLWRTDERAAKWHGTMLGAFQTFNTYANHYRPNSEIGPERTMTATISGDIARADAEFFNLIAGLDDLKVHPDIEQLVSV